MNEKYRGEGFPEDDGARLLPLASPVEDEPPVAIPVWLTCWRCAKSVESSHDFCPYCRARLAPAAPAVVVRAPAPADHDFQMIARVLWVFGGLLATSVIYGCLEQFGFSDKANSDLGTFRQQLYRMLALEIIDALLVVAALCWITRPPAEVRPTLDTRLSAWAGSLPLVVLLLALNWGYHALLKNFLSVPLWFDEIVIKSELTGLSVLATCVQPAVVEELFFRYLALGTLRRFMGIHGAILVSSVMFGMAHIGVPLSIPMLTVIGVVLGYARIVSGGLALPMFMHFCHNAAILYLEACS